MHSDTIIPCVYLWRGGRVVEGAALEMLCRATYRGFESHPLRQFRSRVLLGSAPWVPFGRKLRIPPSPPVLI
jgi:hypothetical protein